MLRASLFILLLSSTINAYSNQAEPLTIRLLQMTDSSCSNNYTNTDITIPDGCIQYQIHLSNTFPEVLRNLSIVSKIPQYTHLQQTPLLIINDQPPQKVTYSIQQHPEQDGDTLRMTLKELHPTTEQATIIQYSVKIDE
ncbi:MAG: Unknown protein [uncultured Thiotrichaceae bacterium]|uniref:DUF11 domain-containing protein n=1 Tax=uncultured Thiotrichaceae bacterium TaxID=298394 RepID=A0A6S6SB82_9GAMM|nr:MAG: Unknown protein [uncultured Thiotrichaceae bacterium]